MIGGTIVAVVFKKCIRSSMYWAPALYKAHINKADVVPNIEDCLLKILSLGFQPDSTVC